jgi:hypothetical protein
MGLRIEKSNLVIIDFHCPNVDSGSGCKKYSDGCVVEWFVHQFGLECNVGMCEPAPELVFAWAITGEPELGFDMCQVWIIPVNDELFSAWVLTQ